MENLKMAAFALFATAAVTAQDLQQNQIPESLNTAFQQDYPQATDVEWEMDGMNYKVEFDLGKMDNEIYFTTDGNVLKSEMEMAEKDLPAAVAGTVKNKYPKYKVDEIEVTEENGVRTYEVELEKWFSDDIKLLLSEDGTLISEVK